MYISENLTVGRIFIFILLESIYLQSAVVEEVERWPHTAVSVDSNTVAGDRLLQFADYICEVFISHEKHGGSKATLISRGF